MSGVAGGGDGSPALPSMTRAQVADEVAQGRRKLLIIDGAVLDVGAFIREHPGGPEVIEDYLGRDATGDFHSVGHSLQARGMVARFVVATLVDG